jgi:acyl-coenzyme A synthetase/AMP-(fatty) acid ligase
LDFLERTEPSVRTLIGKLRSFLLELDKTLNSGGRGLNNRSVEELILYLQRVNESSNLEVDDHIDEVIRSKIIAKLKGDENSRDMVDELVALLESDKCPTMLTASLKVARELRSQLNDFGAFKAFR